MNSCIDWEIKTPRSETNIDKSIGIFPFMLFLIKLVQPKNVDKAKQQTIMKENHYINDSNASKSKLSDFNMTKMAFDFKKGPIIDSNNACAEVCECLDLNQGDRLAVKTYKVEKSN